VEQLKVEESFKVLHKVREETKEVLAQIFNKSMQIGDVPRQWTETLRAEHILMHS